MLSIIEINKWEQIFELCKHREQIDYKTCLNQKRKMIKIFGLSWKIREVLAKHQFPTTKSKLKKEGISIRIFLSMQNNIDVFINYGTHQEEFDLTDYGHLVKNFLSDQFDKFGVC